MSQDIVLITGGAGFIGRYIAKACLARGYRVRVLDQYGEASTLVLPLGARNP